MYFRIGSILFFFLSIILLLSNINSTYSEDSILYLSDIGAFKENIKISSPDERFNICLDTLEKSDNEDVLLESINLLLKNSLSSENNQESLSTLNTFCEKKSQNSKVYGRAKLAIARLLLRLDQYESAMLLFKEGIIKRWHGNPFWEMNDGLIETKRYLDLAIDEFNRGFSDEYDEETKNFYGLNVDVSNIIIKLIDFKTYADDNVARYRVYPQLLSSKQNLLIKDMVKAICFAMDDKYKQALDFLDEIKSKIEENKSNYEKEYLCVPLVMGFVKILSDPNNPASNSDIKVYIDRNINNPDEILLRLLELTYAMEKSHKYCVFVSNITSAILESDLIMDSLIKSKIREDLVASVYDMHAQGLYLFGDIDGSREIWTKVVADYYPRNLASINALFNLARLYYLHEKDYGKTIELCETLLLLSPSDELDKQVKLLYDAAKERKGN